MGKFILKYFRSPANTSCPQQKKKKKKPSPPFSFLRLGEAARSHVANFKADVSDENPFSLSGAAQVPYIPLPFL